MSWNFFVSMWHCIIMLCPCHVYSATMFMLCSFPTRPTFQGGELPEVLGVADQVCFQFQV